MAQVSERYGQIAFFLLKDVLRKKGISVNSEVIREVAQITDNVNALGIEPKANRREVAGFMSDMIMLLAQETAERLQKVDQD